MPADDGVEFMRETGFYLLARLASSADVPYHPPKTPPKTCSPGLRPVTLGKNATPRMVMPERITDAGVVAEVAALCEGLAENWRSPTTARSVASLVQRVSTLHTPPP